MVKERIHIEKDNFSSIDKKSAERIGNTNINSRNNNSLRWQVSNSNKKFNISLYWLILVEDKLSEY